MSLRDFCRVLCLSLALALPAALMPATASADPLAPHEDIVFDRVFIFFRDQDATLTPLMVKQVTKAAELARSGGATRIKITGYSDARKSPEALGLARAEAVKLALVRQGVPEASIQTQARVKAPPASKVGGENPANHRVRIALMRGFTAPVGPNAGTR